MVTGHRQCRLGGVEGCGVSSISGTWGIRLPRLQACKPLPKHGQFLEKEAGPRPRGALPCPEPPTLSPAGTCARSLFTSAPSRFTIRVSYHGSWPPSSISAPTSEPSPPLCVALTKGAPSPGPLGAIAVLQTLPNAGKAKARPARAQPAPPPPGTAPPHPHLAGLAPRIHVISSQRPRLGWSGSGRRVSVSCGARRARRLSAKARGGRGAHGGARGARGARGECAAGGGAAPGREGWVAQRVRVPMVPPGEGVPGRLQRGGSWCASGGGQGGRGGWPDGKDGAPVGAAGRSPVAGRVWG